MNAGALALGRVVGKELGILPVTTGWLGILVLPTSVTGTIWPVAVAPNTLGLEAGALAVGVMEGHHDE